MSLGDSERHERIPESGRYETPASVGHDARNKVSVVIEGGVPGLHTIFLGQNGIEAEAESDGLPEGQTRITTVTATREQLIKELQEQNGVIIVVEPIEQVA